MSNVTHWLATETGLKHPQCPSAAFSGDDHIPVAQAKEAPRQLPPKR